MNKQTVFDKLDFPRKPNYQYTGEYCASKVAKAVANVGKLNSGDNIERNVEITNYLVRKQLAKTTMKLENKRKDYNDQRKKVLEQWEDLHAKECGLRENFIRFNLFVKENQEKKERAIIKIAEQNKLKEERQKQTNELLQKCEDITKIKTKMDHNISQYKIYEVFLLSVVESEDTIQCINDLLKRYEALISARKELNDMQQRDMMKLETAKSNLVDIKESCERMYLEICHRKKMKPTYLNNAEKQLLVIKQAIGEYEIINRRVKEIEEKTIKESIEPRVSASSY